MSKRNFDGLPDHHILAEEALDFYDQSPVPQSSTEQDLLDLESLQEEVKIHHPAITETIDLSFTEPNKT